MKELKKPNQLEEDYQILLPLGECGLRECDRLRCFCDGRSSGDSVAEDEILFLSLIHI